MSELLKELQGLKGAKYFADAYQQRAIAQKNFDPFESRGKVPYIKGVKAAAEAIATDLGNVSRNTQIVALNKVTKVDSALGTAVGLVVDGDLTVCAVQDALLHILRVAQYDLNKVRSILDN